MERGPAGAGLVGRGSPLLSGPLRLVEVVEQPAQRAGHGRAAMCSTTADSCGRAPAGRGDVVGTGGEVLGIVPPRWGW
jgi:hypothetical protein